MALKPLALNTLARLGLAAVLVGAVSACSPGGSEFDQEWAAQQSAAASTATPQTAQTPEPTPATTPQPSGGQPTGPQPTAPEPSSSPSSIKGAKHVFPVRSAKVRYGAYHHDYPAADIFAPCGTRVDAPFSGRISEVSRKDVWSSKTNDGGERGGLSVTLVGDDGVRYYGSHLRSIDASIRPGTMVDAGSTLGRVGNTGDAAGIACHLHFGISPACGVGDWKIRRGAVPPYRFLRSWQRNGDLSPAKTVATWQKTNGCA